MKGTGLLKLCVLSLFTLGISYFGLLKNSYVNAGYVGYLGTSQSSTLNQDYNILVNAKGNLLTTYIGLGKNLLMLNDGVYFFWSQTGTPYVYITSDSSNPNTHFAQGYINDYMLCDYIGMGTGNAVSPQNCNHYSVSQLSSVLVRFLNSLTSSDYYYYDYYSLNAPAREAYCGTLYVCFSSSSMNKSLCFYASNGQNAYPCPVPDYYGNTNTNLSDSLELSPYFDSIPTSILGSTNSFGTGGNIDGGSQVVNPNTTTGDVMTTNCTKSRALSWYRANGYKSRMCYSSYLNTTDLYTGPGDAVGYALTGVDMMEVRFNTAGYRRNGTTGSGMPYTTWFDYWRKTYEVYQKNPEHTNPFLGVPVSIFTLMGNVESYALPYSNASIIEFCDLSLYTSDYTKEYTGIAQNTVCNMSAIDLLEITMYNTENPDDGYPGYGNTALSGSNGTIGSSRQGITNRSGFTNVPGNGYHMSGLSAFTDGKSFQNNFFNLLKSSFRYIDGSNQTGFIPSYIIIFLCGLVIFRFLSH